MVGPLWPGASLSAASPWAEPAGSRRLFASCAPDTRHPTPTGTPASVLRSAICQSSRHTPRPRLLQPCLSPVCPRSAMPAAAAAPRPRAAAIPTCSCPQLLTPQLTFELGFERQIAGRTTSSISTHRSRLPARRAASLLLGTAALNETGVAALALADGAVDGAVDLWRGVVS